MKCFSLQWPHFQQKQLLRLCRTLISPCWHFFFYFIIFQYTDNPFNEPFLHFKGKNKSGQYTIRLFGRGCTCYVEKEQTEQWSISLRDQSKLTADCKCCFMLEFLTATAWSQRRVLPPAEQLSSEPIKNERFAKSKTMSNRLGKSHNSCLNVETTLYSAWRKCSFSCNNCQHFKNQSATTANFSIPNYTQLVIILFSLLLNHKNEMWIN